MKKLLLLITLLLLVSCTSSPTTTITSPEPKPIETPSYSCADLTIDVHACLDSDTIRYTVTGNIPFSYQYVGLGTGHIQGTVNEVLTEHTGTIVSTSRIRQISINPYVNGILCNDRTEMVDVMDC